jgi:translation elongation factor EF-4
MPDEEPAVPIEPAVAAARTRYVKAKIEIVKGLKGDGMTQAEAQEHAEVKDFAEKYPALFKMLFKIDINNEASLRTMLAMLERMGTGDMSQDQASTVVGQRLYDTFIKSKIGEDRPPPT